MHLNANILIYSALYTPALAWYMWQSYENCWRCLGAETVSIYKTFPSFHFRVFPSVEGGCAKLQACYVDRSCCARRSTALLRIDGLCGSVGWAGRCCKISNQWKNWFLLIWLNQCRQKQPIHDSGNVWILRRALTYITMTSKHNLRRHVVSLFLMFSSLSPGSLAATCDWSLSPPPSSPNGEEKPCLC